MSVTITVDGRKIEAPEGALLIDVCRDNGIEIPHYCYHPGLGPDGNCRMCQVEFLSDRGNRLGISCKAVVVDGMEVSTQSDAAKRARASVEEFLLLNHPLDCPICDKAGECTLQNYYMEHDLEDSRMNFTRFKKGKAKDIGPTLILDQERCVLCDRCVRFLRDVAGDEQLFIAGRGHNSFITTFPGQEVTSPYSLNTVDICPVGALTAKDFRFSSPTWYLKNTPTVCTTCSRGCSMELQAKDGKVLRFRPRHNPDVNGYWACDEGRLNYKFVNENRITTPLIRRGDDAYEASHEEVVTEIRQTLGYAPAGKAKRTGETTAVLLASATCTVEELFQLKRLAAALDNAPVFVARHIPDGVDDELLRRADRHPNARGAELLGLNVIDLQGDAGESNATAVRDALGASRALVMVGFNTDISSAVDGLAKAAKKVIALAGCENGLTAMADIVVPGLTWAEKDGLVVNLDGHVQRLKAGTHGAGVSEWIILEKLIASLEGEKPREFISQIRKEISEKETSFGGLNLAGLGPLGIRVSGQTVG